MIAEWQYGAARKSAMQQVGHRVQHFFPSCCHVISVAAGRHGVSPPPPNSTAVESTNALSVASSRSQTAFLPVSVMVRLCGTAAVFVGFAIEGLCKGSGHVHSALHDFRMVLVLNWMPCAWKFSTFCHKELLATFQSTKVHGRCPTVFAEEPLWGSEHLTTKGWIFQLGTSAQLSMQRAFLYPHILVSFLVVHACNRNTWSGYLT